MDPVKEVRAMVLVTLPYPPLPVIAFKLASDEQLECEETITSSHNIVAMALNHAMYMNDNAANSVRRTKQQDVFREFLHAMAVKGFDLNQEDLYNLYCDFARRHILCYGPSDLQFKPMNCIYKGDAIHAKMCEYMAGQSIFYEDKIQVSAQEYAKKSYGELLVELRARLGHTMTPEEHQSVSIETLD